MILPLKATLGLIPINYGESLEKSGSKCQTTIMIIEKEVINQYFYK
jgi:hypothetical protein